MKYSRIVSEITSTPWAITQQKLETIIGIVEAREHGLQISADVKQELEDIKAAREERMRQHSGPKIRVIPLHGTISHRPSMFASGGLSAEEFVQEFNAAINDNSVESVILDVDSPGGSVFGLDEAAEAVYQARGAKPIVAVANAEAHSAAYQIASQADEFIVAPSGMAGSIGVITAHVDDTAADEKEGYKVTYIHAGENKAEGWEGSLSDDHRAHLQSIVDSYYETFVSHVARGRGVSAETVLSDFGGGRSFTSQQLLERNMVDRIATFNQVIDEQKSSIQQRQRGRKLALAQRR